MKAPLSWLKEYVDIDCSPDELKEKLFGCGFEVEDMYEIGRDISDVVVGEVKECEGIEGTHLHKCTVDCGINGNLQIMCGADNVKVGVKVPAALIGATVYKTSSDHKTIEGVTKIQKGKLRGVESYGMLCSGTELGVTGDMYEGADCDGLLILPESCENGADVKPVLGLDDVIFDVAISANRPDCQSIYGLSREIAAALGKKIKKPALDYTETPDSTTMKVTVHAPELCPRYMGHLVKDIKPGRSPLWMRRYLTLCDIRAISNVVDITNFVLLELGQPMHAFDTDNLSGNEINVRCAREGEEIVTLDEKKFRLGPSNLVICDGDKPCALAGIMGGLNSEIKDTTKTVFFEAAKFARDCVRKTSRSLGQHSDSSAAFEKGVSEYTTEMAMKRALHLIEELGCGTVTSVHCDVRTKCSDMSVKKMTVSVKKINAVLGIEVPSEDVVRILEGLYFGVEKKSDDELFLTLPGWRDDIEDYPDIAEEVIRSYGYDKITPTFMPTAKVTNGGYSKEQREELALKDELYLCGMSEISTYSFYSEKDLDLLKFPAEAKERKFVKIMNPLGEDLSVMRTTLAPSMVKTAISNIRKGNLEGKLYELSKIYVPRELPVTTQPDEVPTLCMCMFGGYGFFDLKGVIEDLAASLNTKYDFVPSEKPFLHPGICADVFSGDTKIGFIGELSPVICEELSCDKKIVVAELDYKAMRDTAKGFKFTPLPKFPEVKRDLALVCDEKVTCKEIEEAIYASSKYVTDVRLFDMYTGDQIEKGKKSMAFTVTLTPGEEAITAENSDGYFKKILKGLQKIDIQLR
ncbi:MAG: phenylalanine--tRNA ligase subunit beta [Clostridia bacterium]|nr:phenylalanine--tRNA ligase subunit beta [Clostridia bacterium]